MPEVKLRGVCGALFNGKHQMLGIQMCVPGARIHSRAASAFRGPPSTWLQLPIADLLQFSRAHDMGHRVRLRER